MRQQHARRFEDEPTAVGELDIPTLPRTRTRGILVTASRFLPIAQFVCAVALTLAALAVVAAAAVIACR